MNDEQMENYRNLLRDRTKAQKAHDERFDELFPDAAKPVDERAPDTLPSAAGLEELDRLLQEYQAAEQRLSDWLQNEPGLR